MRGSSPGSKSLELTFSFVVSCTFDRWAWTPRAGIAYCWKRWSFSVVAEQENKKAVLVRRALKRDRRKPAEWRKSTEDESEVHSERARSALKRDQQRQEEKTVRVETSAVEVEKMKSELFWGREESAARQRVGFQGEWQLRHVRVGEVHRHSSCPKRHRENVSHDGHDGDARAGAGSTSTTSRTRWRRESCSSSNSIRDSCTRCWVHSTQERRRGTNPRSSAQFIRDGWNEWTVERWWKERKTAREWDPRTQEDNRQGIGTPEPVETQFQIEQPRATTAERELENALIQTLVTTRNRRREARSTRGLARCCGAAAGTEVKSEGSTRVTENKRWRHWRMPQQRP